MISGKKLRDYAKRILDKSKNDKVAWVKAGQSNTGFPRYEVDLQNTRVTVELESPPSDPDQYDFIIWHRNTAVGALSATEERPEDWRLLEELYSEAARVVVGWDKAIKELDDALNDDDQVMGQTQDDVPW